MKNFKLLLATTAILSTGAILANAVTPQDSGSTQISGNTTTTIHAKAKLITNLSIREDAVLDFGSILAPRNNQIVKITAEGVCGGDGTNATFVDDAHSAGSIAVKGNYFVGENGYTISQETGAANHTFERYSLEFPNTMTLKSGNTVCGVVSDFTQSSAPNDVDSLGEEIVINYGGTLTLDKNIETSLALNQTVECEGEATVTLVYEYSSSGTGGGGN